MNLVLSLKKVRYISFLNTVSISLFSFALVCFSIFLCLNGNYIIHPTTSPFFNLGAPFGDGPAKFEFFGIITPLNIFAFLILLHLITLINLLISKKLIPLYPVVFLGVGILVFNLFYPGPCDTCQLTYGIFAMVFLKYLDFISIDLGFLSFVYVALLCILLIVIIAIKTKFKLHRVFLITSFFNTILFLIICVLNFILFFD